MIDTEMMPLAASEEERRELVHLQSLFPTAGIPRLIGPHGEELPLPETAYHLLRQIVAHLVRGEAVSIIPIDKMLTTQEAAAFLDVSRPFLIKLLDRGEMPFTKVGTHRRIRFGDVIAYKLQRDEQEHKGLDELTQMSQDFGMYR
jgi:excisionase family DNA binding protein